jgi:NhaP-type Na+/H+ or K+/H+ antiporter
MSRQEKEMLLLFVIAGAAALAVASYTRLRNRSPEAAQAMTRTIRELAAVVVVCSKAVEGIVEALTAGARPRYATTGGDWSGGYVRPLVESWDEE